MDPIAIGFKTVEFFFFLIEVSEDVVLIVFPSILKALDQPQLHMSQAL